MNPKVGLQHLEAIRKSKSKANHTLERLFSSPSKVEIEASLIVVVSETKRITFDAKTCDYKVYLCPRRFVNVEMAKGTPLADPQLQHSEMTNNHASHHISPLQGS